MAATDRPPFDRREQPRVVGTKRLSESNQEPGQQPVERVVLAQGLRDSSAPTRNSHRTCTDTPSTSSSSIASSASNAGPAGRGRLAAGR
jgi:hypothetical protein